MIPDFFVWHCVAFPCLELPPVSLQNLPPTQSPQLGSWGQALRKYNAGLQQSDTFYETRSWQKKSLPKQVSAIKHKPTMKLHCKWREGKKRVSCESTYSRKVDQQVEVPDDASLDMSTSHGCHPLPMLPLLLCHIHNSQPPRFIFLQVLPGPIISIGTFICLHVPPRFLSFHIPIIFHTAGKSKNKKNTQQKQQHHHHHHHQRSALSTKHFPLLEWTTGSRRESTKKELHKPDHGAAILRILSRTLRQDQAEIIIGKLQTCQKQTKGNGKQLSFLQACVVAKFLVRSQRGSSIVDELAGVELGLGLLTMGSTCKKTINENFLRKSDIYRKHHF